MKLPNIISFIVNILLSRFVFHHFNTLLLYHFITVSLYYWITLSLYHFITASLYHMKIPTITYSFLYFISFLYFLSSLSFFKIYHHHTLSLYILNITILQHLIHWYYSTKHLYGRYGQFYGGDSYVVLYTYKKGTKDQHMIYFWLGHSSSKDEIGEIITFRPINQLTMFITSYPWILLFKTTVCHYAWMALLLDLFDVIVPYIITRCDLCTNILLLLWMVWNVGTGSAALLAAEMDRKLGGAPVEVSTHTL